MTKIIFELDFILDMYRYESDGLLEFYDIRDILEACINNCVLLDEIEFYKEYGIDANPDAFCYEVIFSGDYVESFWFSIDDFWNNWDTFKDDEIEKLMG